MKRKPILSGVCAVVMFLAIVLPFVLGPERGDSLDVQIRHWLPFVGAALVAAAFVRRERVVWPVIGLLLTGIYVGLHLICGDRDTSAAEKLRSYLLRQRKEMIRVTSKPYHVKSVPTLCFDISSIPHELPQEHWIHVFVSPSGTNAMATGASTYPVGTVILKEKFIDAGATNTEFYTGMRKRERGYNPKLGDWEFFTLDRRGQKVTACGTIESCMDCHTKYKRTDFVSRVYVTTKGDTGW